MKVHKLITFKFTIHYLLKGTSTPFLSNREKYYELDQFQFRIRHFELAATGNVLSSLVKDLVTGR